MFFQAYSQAYSLLLLPVILLSQVTDSLAQINPDTPLENATQTQNNNLEKAKQLYLKGMEYYYGGEYNNAIREFEQALTLSPNYLDAHTGIGLAQSELGNHQAAINSFTKILVIAPNYYNAYYNRASNYKALGNFQQALQDLTKTLELTNNTHVPALINRANLYVKLKQERKAKQDLDRAIQVNPHEATAYVNRALVNLLLSQRKAAQTDLNRAEELYQKDGNPTGVQQVRKIRRSLGL